MLRRNCAMFFKLVFTMRNLHHTIPIFIGTPCGTILDLVDVVYWDTL